MWFQFLTRISGLPTWKGVEEKSSVYQVSIPFRGLIAIAKKKAWSQEK
jgi:hypothetical protein